VSKLSTLTPLRSSAIAGSCPAIVTVWPDNAWTASPASATIASPSRTVTIVASRSGSTSIR
jgi:hypothetical protein